MLNRTIRRQGAPICCIMENKMTLSENPSEKSKSTMEILLPIAFLVAWIVLQAWVLPRFGVKT